MARKPRVDLAGFYHIIDRGVDRMDVFSCSQDKDKFLQILCKACKDYKVNVHDYCLMDNHYHLLIETTDGNLSYFMRQLNGNYSIYFNKKQKRSGHLWQGRYLSHYIFDESYLLSLFRYIEHNPIKANMCDKVGEYQYTLLATLLNVNLNEIECATHSRIKRDLEGEGFLDLIELALSEDELERLKEKQKRKIDIKEHEVKFHKLKSLEEHFDGEKDRMDRNFAIMNALDDGYSQASVSRFLGTSTSLVSKIAKEMR